MIQGIDVSHHQGVIDVVTVREAGFRFCVVKATEGVDYEDPAFRRTLAAIAALPAGALPFYPGASWTAAIWQWSGHGLADDAWVDDQTWWYLVNTGLR